MTDARPRQPPDGGAGSADRSARGRAGRRLRLRHARPAAVGRRAGQPGPQLRAGPPQPGRTPAPTLLAAADRVPVTGASPASYAAADPARSTPLGPAARRWPSSRAAPLRWRYVLAQLARSQPSATGSDRDMADGRRRAHRLGGASGEVATADRSGSPSVAFPASDLKQAVAGLEHHRGDGCDLPHAQSFVHPSGRHG